MKRTKEQKLLYEDSEYKITERDMGYKDVFRIIEIKSEIQQKKEKDEHSNS